MRRAAIWLLAACAGCSRNACGPSTGQPSLQDAADASTSTNLESSAADAGALVWPAAIETTAFTADAAFVAFQDARTAVIVDLRGRRGIARNAAGPYETSGPWQTYNLPMEENITYNSVRTVHDGQLAVLAAAGQLEDLGSGRAIAAKGEVHEAFVAELAGDATIVRPHGGGPEGRLPPGLQVVAQGTLLLGTVQEDGGAAVAVADPKTMRVARLPLGEPSILDGAWLNDERSKVLVLSNTSDGSTERDVGVYEFPSGTRVVSAKSRGLVVDHRVSDDRSVIAWAESNAGRCGVGMIVVSTSKVSRSDLFPCRHAEFEAQIAFVVVEGSRVVVSVGAIKTFDPSTGMPTAGPRPRVHVDLTPLDRKAFAKELAAVKKERPELARFSPLLLDRAALEKRHGYEVVVFGNANTVLVHRGADYSLCEVARGEPCRPAFRADGEVDGQFSRDGKKLAVVSPDRVWVLEGTTGATLFEAPHPIAPAKPRIPK